MVRLSRPSLDTKRTGSFLDLTAMRCVRPNPRTSARALEVGGLKADVQNTADGEKEGEHDAHHLTHPLSRSQSEHTPAGLARRVLVFRHERRPPAYELGYAERGRLFGDGDQGRTRVCGSGCQRGQRSAVMTAVVLSSASASGARGELRVWEADARTLKSLFEATFGELVGFDQKVLFGLLRALHKHICLVLCDCSGVTRTCIAHASNAKNTAWAQ